MLVINAFTFSTNQYYFMIQILFINILCLCWALNIMIIKFCNLSLCLTIVKNYKLYWICCMNSTAKFFNIFCCLNIKFFTTFNLLARVSLFFTFLHHSIMTIIFSNCFFSIAILLFIIVSFETMQYLIN